MRYRVDELASQVGLSVDTVRYYQSQGLLPQPAKDGRRAWYSDEHLARMKRILALKAKGFSLGAIRGLFAGELDPSDAALVLAVAGSDQLGDGAALTLEELAARTGISPALLHAISREGLLTARGDGGEAVYSEADIGVIKAGLELLEAGLPLSELLALAREHDAAVRKTAERAVEMFLRFVRDPIRARAADDDQAADEVVAAFRKMLPATTSLVAEHFRGVLMREAEARISKGALEGELEAVRGSTGPSARHR